MTLDPIGRIGLGWSLVTLTVGLGTEIMQKESFKSPSESDVILDYLLTNQMDFNSISTTHSNGSTE